MKSLRSRSAGEAVHPPRGAQGSTAQQHASCRPAALIPGTDPEVRCPGSQAVLGITGCWKQPRCHTDRHRTSTGGRQEAEKGSFCAGRPLQGALEMKAATCKCVSTRNSMAHVQKLTRN